MAALLGLSLIFSPVPLNPSPARAQTAVAVPALTEGAEFGPLGILAAIFLEYALCAGDPTKADRTILGQMLKARRDWDLGTQEEGRMLEAGFRARAALQRIRQEGIPRVCPAVRLSVAQAEIALRLALLMDGAGILESLRDEATFTAEADRFAADPLFVAGLNDVALRARTAFYQPLRNVRRDVNWSNLRSCLGEPGVIWQMATLGLLGVGGTMLLLGGFYSARADWLAFQSGHRPAGNSGKGGGGLTAWYIFGPLGLFVSAPFFVAMKIGLEDCLRQGKLASRMTTSHTGITMFGTLLYMLIGASAVKLGMKFWEHGTQVRRSLSDAAKADSLARPGTAQH
ncbi:MAG: hypothetical protein V1798_06380 [Pseudomonadota bacterium]